MGKQIIIADSTQIDTFLTCPQMWKYGFNESLELSTDNDENNSQKAIRMGTYGHFWMDKYYSARALNTPLLKATEFANAELEQVDTIDQDPKDNHKFPLSKENRDQVKQRLQQYWMTYSNDDFRPACKQIESIEINSDGLPFDMIKRQPLVEQGFSYELFNSPEYLFILEGRIDLIAPMGNSSQLGFVDHKFQLRERQLYNKSIQFKNYALVTGLNFGTINYIRLHKDVSNKTFKRELISFNSAELRSWRSELIGIFEMIAIAMKKGEYGFLRNRSACPGKFGYPCQFTHICEEPSHNIGNNIKVQMYRKKEEWKPW